MKTPPEIQLDENGFPRLSQPARRALAGAGIQRLEQLAGFSEAEIKRLHGIGPNAIAQLRLALAARGQAFADRK
jgi:predicted RecB family nuclease